MTTVELSPDRVRARPRRGIRPKASAIRNRSMLAAVAFLAPALLALLVLRIIPAAMAIWQGFFHKSILAGGNEWVGLANYANLFGSAQFQGSVLVTLLFAIIINPLQVILALALAVLYTRRVFAAKIWRSFVILPIAAPAAVSTVIWSVIYRPDGLGNAFLGMLGIPPQPYVTSSHQALISIIVLMSWTGVGYWMMFLIAGINDVPAELDEAASLDGANAWRRFFSVTLPMIRRPLAFVLVADTVANFLVFAPVQIITQGGPAGSTNLLMYDIYQRAYTLGDANTADAEVVILVLITLIVVAVQFRLLGNED